MWKQMQSRIKIKDNSLENYNMMWVTSRVTTFSSGNR